MKNKIWSLLLCLLLLTGCGNDIQVPQKTDAPAPDLPEQAAPEMVYQPTFLPLEGEIELGYIDYFCVSGEQVFFASFCEVGTKPALNEFTGEPYLDSATGEPIMTTVNETLLFSMPLTGGPARQIEAYSQPQLPEGMLGHSYIGALLPGSDGSVWIPQVSRTYFYDVPADFDPATDDGWQYYTEGETIGQMLQFSSDGRFLQSLELDRMEELSLGDLVLLEGRTLLGSDWQNIYIYDLTDGSLKKTLPIVDSGVGDLLALSDTQVAYTVWNSGGSRLIPLDPVTFEPQTAVTVPRKNCQFYAGGEEYLCLYACGGNLYALDRECGEHLLFSWMDSDVDSSYLNPNLVRKEDGTIYVVQGSGLGLSDPHELIVMKQVDAASLPQKQQLTLACFHLDWLMRSEIVAFNKASPDTRILVRDYGEYATEDDPYAGLQKLNTEILSGSVPDLILTNPNLPLEQYAAKGILLDLWPLIDSDPELRREDLMLHLFETMSIDGKLYQVLPSFTIETAAGKTALVGEGERWSLSELQKARAFEGGERMIFGLFDTKSGILNECVGRSIDRFIDWETGQCHFDSPEFTDLLRFADSFPTEAVYEDVFWGSQAEEPARLKNEQQLLYRVSLTSFDQFQYACGVFGEGESVNFIGYPTATGSGSAFRIGNGIAIFSSCHDPQAAWSFARTILTEAYQTGGTVWEFPTNRHAFDAMVQRTMTPIYEIDPETGEETEVPRIAYWFSEDHTLEIMALTQDEFDRFWSLYERCETIIAYDSGIMKLIEEETEAFFARQRTAEETAALLQNRISLYVAEQG